LGCCDEIGALFVTEIARKSAHRRNYSGEEGEQNGDWNEDSAKTSHTR
jgi:hypothetical protein